MTVTLHKLARLCVAALAQLAICGLLPVMDAHAQATPRVERVSPVWRASLSTMPVTTAYWYATPGEAFAAHAAWWAASATPPYTRQAFNFRPCPGTQQYGYFNGIPHSWCHDYTVYYGGNFQYGGTTSTVSWSPICPENFQGMHVVPPTGGTAGQPYQIRFACERQLAPTQCPPSTCNGLGNPIFPEDSSKRQTEIDYTAPGGTLSFRRHFHSEFGGFFHSFQTPVRRAYNLEQFAGESPATSTSCFAGRFRLFHQASYLYVPHCFPYVTDDAMTGSTHIRVPAGTVMRFDSSGSAIDLWNAGSYLLPRTVNGQPGHALLQKASTKIDFYDAQWRLVERNFANGRKVTAAHGPSGLTSLSDEFGRSLNFSYDSSGRLSTMTDPSGGIFRYAYEANPAVPIATCKGEGCQRIASVIYPDLKTRTYHWDEAAHIVNPPFGLSVLTGITDELDDRFATYKYSDRRAISTERAGLTLRYQITQFQATYTTISDPRGMARTYNFSAGAGLKLLTSVSSWCPTCLFQSAVYDANGNAASRNDFKGNTTCYAYDLTRNLETKRIEGAPSGTACNVALTTPPTGSRLISTEWHPDWRLETKIAEPKRLTTISYNGQGATCAPSTVLVDGKPPAVICTRTEQATTDETGASGFAATVAGTARTWRYTYTTYGRVLTATDPNNRTTSISYHPDNDADLGKRGNVASITNAANHITYITDYNLHGQPTRIVDLNGVVTVLTYDPRMRLTSRTVGNEATVFGYDPVGQMTSVNLPDGARLTYTYDAAHRLTAINDHKGNRIDYTLDAMGNRTAEQIKDPGGVLVGNIARVMDVLNRVQQVTGAVQ